MEEEKKLYPLKFCALQDDYPWGSETFQLADLGYRDSLVREGWLAGNSIAEVMDTYLDRVVGDAAYAFYGRQFPLCVRQLHVRGRMPLRVHPDDEIAAQRYDFLGKEKLWYVLRAGKDARLMVGFRADTDASSFYGKCLDGSVEELLGVIAPHAGQCLLIPPGTPHAAAGDLDILEIAESSPMDFCLCDWGEELHPDEFDPALTLVDALDFIGYKRFGADSPVKPANDGRRMPANDGKGMPATDGGPANGAVLADLPQLHVEKLPLHAPLALSHDATAMFLLYTCVRGAASVQLPLPGGQHLDFPLRSGETMLVPAECAEFHLVPLERDTLLLESSVRPKETDSYINPDAEPVLEDEEESS